MPDVEVVADEPLVRQLLATLPGALRHLSAAPVESVATGWDNAVWCHGDLRVLWTTFEVTQRDRAVRRLEASGAYDDAVWVRARGWAAAFVLGVDADASGRAVFAATVEHARAQLGCP